MTIGQLLQWTAGILTAINEVSPDSPIPASSIYLAMGMNLQEYELVRDCMVRCNYITATPSTIKLTELGKAKAIEIEQALARSK